MLVRRPLSAAPQLARVRCVVDAKIHKRRQEWLSRTYPRAATETPNALPRRGRRGGWMRTPSVGVPKLDGTNIAQQVWWEERSDKIHNEMAEQLRAEASSGTRFTEVLDTHLERIDALKVQMPSADEFLKPHLKKLASVTKPNPVHDALVESPPVAAADVERPSFLDASLSEREYRRRRRGRFLGVARQAAAAHAGHDAFDAEVPQEVARLQEESDAKVGDEIIGARHGRRSILARAASAGVARVASRSSRGEDLSEAGSAVSASGARKVSDQQSDEAYIPSTDMLAAGHSMGQTPTGPEPSEPVRATSLSELWAGLGASWIVHNSCVVPSVFPDAGLAPEAEAGGTSSGAPLLGATLKAYWHTRKAASLFDVSFKVCFRITGADREFVADQFLSCKLQAMRAGDVQYACIVDSKGLMLDDAFVYLTGDSVEVVTSGCHAASVAKYLGQYVVYVRRSGADVLFEHVQHAAAIALQGPRAREALRSALRRLSDSEEHEPVWLVPPGSECGRPGLQDAVLDRMPFMSYLELRRRGSGAGEESAVLLCAGSTGEDGFEVLATLPRAAAKGVGSTSKGFALQLAEALLEDPLVQPAGAYCLDVLRMEAGLPRMGADIPPGTVTPVRASLAWTLDQSKMRNHLMFGWEKMFLQLAKGPTFRRVGLMLGGPAHGGCRILSNPHRQPIGQITTTAWSPRLQARIAQAYVKPEYARVNKQVLITVPYNLPMHKMRKQAIKKLMKQGPELRSSYRSLVAAIVMPLPFVPHSYPEPERQRKSLARANARMRTFQGDSEGSAAATAGPVPAKPHADPRRGAPLDRRGGAGGGDRSERAGTAPHRKGGDPRGLVSEL